MILTVSIKYFEWLFMEIYEKNIAKQTKIRDLQASFDKSMKILESYIAESITNKQKLNSIKRDLKEANEIFLEAEKCLDDLKVDLQNSTGQQNKSLVRYKMSETVTVKIEINGVVYPVSCMTGEENRLIESSKEVNKVIASLSNVSETIGETRLLAMTSLILADKLIEQENITDKNNNNDDYMNEIISWLEKATERMNKVAKLLENK